MGHAWVTLGEVMFGQIVDMAEILKDFLTFMGGHAWVTLGHAWGEVTLNFLASQCQFHKCSLFSNFVAPNNVDACLAQNSAQGCSLSQTTSRRPVSRWPKTLHKQPSLEPAAEALLKAPGDLPECPNQSPAPPTATPSNCTLHAPLSMPAIRSPPLSRTR